ncbi:MAG TPA: CRISPR-associated protein Csx3 [Bacteroidetes bacterium]|nr:CRISPR-associated protein Csx3 [Bacteroidota bacterium]
MNVAFEISINENFAVVDFALDGIIAPDVLNGLSPPDPVQENFAHLGVVLSGRGPIWLYGFLVHFYHPTKWVATHDPRVQGAVIVASHTPEIEVGTLIHFQKK